MTGEQFFEIYTNKELRQLIMDCAKNRSRRKEIQEEYVQEAWLVISTAPSGYNTIAYYELAQKAIYSSYWQNRKEYLLAHCQDRTSQSHCNQTAEKQTDNDRYFMKDKVNKGYRN